MDSPIYHLEGVVKAKTEDMEDFVGPLDLILHLLSKNKMEIKDIQISLILDQYLAWMAARKEMDLEVASEFVTMASQLVYIKTRMLLSIHDEEALSEMEQLIASLEEHQRNENYLKIKEITPLLDRRYSYGRDFITKVPETIQPDRTYRYVHDREDLKKAILSVLSRADHQLPPPVAAFQGIVGREPYPVSEKAGEIIRRLLRTGVTRFRALFQGNRSRSEVVATFLAVLELCKAHRLRLAGTEEDCTITSTQGEQVRLASVAAAPGARSACRSTAKARAACPRVRVLVSTAQTNCWLHSSSGINSASPAHSPVRRSSGRSRKNSPRRFSTRRRTCPCRARAANGR